MADSPADQDLADRYTRYNALCNAHDFDRLGEFVAPDVVVNSTERGLTAYAAGLSGLVEAFPDHHWSLRHLVVNRPMVAAHLIATGRHTGAPFLGVPPGGRAVSSQEFAVYAWSGGLIREVWGVGDRLSVLQQLRGDGGTGG